MLIAIAGYINYADSTMNRETESTGAAAEAGDESTAVLDEADKMLDMGFYKDVRKILDSLKNLKQMCICLLYTSRCV